MSRIAVLGAKGGVGKTTIALNLGCVLAQSGRQVVLVDGDLHTPHVNVSLGCMHLPVSIHDVLSGSATLTRSLYVHGSGLRIIPGSMAYDAVSRVSYAQFTHLCQELQGLGELVLIDAPSGFGPALDAVLKG
ncbi:AAA family ATPase, partial [Candidatus Woesearchaeota archaeon]|nr:AAA family ATPase [Candidatus Woesearchaeota archaeon]